MGTFVKRCLPLVVAFVLLAGAAAASEPGGPGLKAGEKAPSFEATSIKGEPLSSGKILQERKALVVNFWGLRCSSCIEEMPFINQLFKKYGTEISILGVNADGIDGPTLEQQIRKVGIAIDYTVVPDPDMKLVDSFKMTAAPLTVVVDRQGTVSYCHEGFVPGDEKALDESIGKAVR